MSFSRKTESQVSDILGRGEIPADLVTIEFSQLSELRRVADEWCRLRATGCKAVTNRVRESAIRHFFNWFEVRGYDINIKTYSEWIGWLRDTLKPISANSIRNEIRPFLKFCANTGITRLYLDEFVPAIKVTGQKPKYFITEEQYQLLKLHARRSGKQYEWLMVAGYNTGMRISDACMLRWGSVDFGSMFIRGLQFKTGFGKTVPIVPGGELHRWLIDFSMGTEMNGDEPVSGFLHARYTKKYNRLKTEMAVIFKKAGTAARFKHFRNTMVTRLANSGIPVPMAMSITGHTSQAVFQEYIVTDPAVLHDAMRKAMDWNPPEGVLPK